MFINDSNTFFGVTKNPLFNHKDRLNKFNKFWGLRQKLEVEFLFIYLLM